MNLLKFFFSLIFVFISFEILKTDILDGKYFLGVVSSLLLVLGGVIGCFSFVSNEKLKHSSIFSKLDMISSIFIIAYFLLVFWRKCKGI